MSKDTNTILCFIYKIYLQRLKSGISRTQSNNFDDSIFKSDKRLSKWADEDINHYLTELHNQELIHRNILGEFSLTDNGIMQMENRFHDDLNSVLDILSKVF